MNSDEEPIDEELRIMDERGRAGSVLTAETFRQPIELLCEGPAATLDITATVGDAVQTMREGRFGSVVITRDGRVAGIVTERDLLMKGAIGQDLRGRPVTQIMTTEPETLRAEDPLIFLMNKMHVGGFRHVPIVDDDDRPLHVISIRDVVAFVLDHFSDEVVNLPSEPYRGERLQHGG